MTEAEYQHHLSELTQSLAGMEYAAQQAGRIHPENMTAAQFGGFVRGLAGFACTARHSLAAMAPDVGVLIDREIERLNAEGIEVYIEGRSDGGK